MKARIKATGKIVEVKYSQQMGPDSVYKDLVTGEHYMDFELSFLPEDGTPDYWTRLEHHYAGMAMQGILSNYDLLKFLCQDGETIEDVVINSTIIVAHALVEKMKEERK